MKKKEIKEKKLTDEEIVKVLECHAEHCLHCDECPLREDSWCSNKVLPMGIDLIHRLQEDYSKLKERYVKVLDLNEKVIAEQKAEIERLTEEANQDTVTHIDLCTENLSLRKQNTELQKQVDELTDHLSEKQNALWDLQDDLDNLLADGKQQAVKDTAKEILQMFDDRNYITESELKKAIAERYGVDIDN